MSFGWTEFLIAASIAELLRIAASVQGKDHENSEHVDGFEDDSLILRNYSFVPLLIINIRNACAGTQASGSRID